jgi:hypothetical protein
MSTWIKTIGTQTGQFILGLTGVMLKNNAGDLVVRNRADSADASVTGSEFLASDDVGLTINSDAAGSGADWSISIARPVSGMSANWTLTLPTTPGSTGQILSTDGAGNTSWVSAGSTASCWTVDTTSFAFGSTSPVAMFTLPANAVIDKVTLIVDTIFDGTPSVSVGISGTASKYLGATDVDLATADRYDVPNQLDADASPEALIITYAAGGATAGAARVLVTYAVPA